MVEPAEDLSVQLSSQRALLRKAEVEIASGRHRLEAQERLVSILQASGRNIAAAERLSDVFKRLLIEWERRRQLTEQRIAHLEHEAVRRRPNGAP
jgi:hypothetical protein